MAAITVQIPYEASFDSPPGQFATAVLRLAENGVASSDLLAYVVPSQVHFIRGSHALAVDTVDGISRGANVYHADGTQVAPGIPARPGETLTVYGFGFGKPDRAPRTGEPAQAAATVPMYGTVQFSTALPEYSQPAVTPLLPLSRYISYWGVTPNAVGVYQMNFTVPPVSPALPGCDASRVTNFTVTYDLGEHQSFSFCVQP